MAEKLFWGDPGAIGTVNANPAHFQGDPDTSSYTGLITRIRSYARAAGSVKSSIYDVSAGIPDTRLWSDDIGQSVVVGWNDLTIDTPVSVVASVGYAVGILGSVSGAVSAKTGTGLTRYYLTGQVYGSFTAPATFSYSATDAIYRDATAVYGWEPPTISSIDDSSIITGQTRTLTGTDFMTASDPITSIEICNNSVYASATVKTAQSNIANQTDTSVDFDCVTTGLSGASWVFLTTDLGQINATGLPVTVGRTVYAWVERADGSISAQPYEVLLI